MLRCDAFRHQIRQAGQGEIDFLPLLAPQVILVVAGKDVHFAAADFEHPRGQLVDEVAIVRDEHHRAGVFLQRFQQHVFGAQVEVVGGFVEQQEIGRVQQHSRQRVAIAFAAGEHANALEHIVLGKQETAQQAAQFGLGAERHGRGARQVVEQARLRVKLLVLVLGEVIGFNIVAQLDIRRAVTGSMPASSLIRVDFPAPFTPTSATRSPRSMVKLTSRNTCLRRSSWPRAGIPPRAGRSAWAAEI